MNRRQFLGTTAAALVAAPLSGSASAQSAPVDKSAAPRKSLPIGVFDPPFNKLSTDEMLDKFASLGIEAVEVGAAGPNGSPHCPRPELVADPAKARAWKKKFDDRGIPIMTLSCHNNALYPDPAKARQAAEDFRQTLQLAGMLEIPTVVGFSGCPGARRPRPCRIGLFIGGRMSTAPHWTGSGKSASSRIGKRRRNSLASTAFTALRWRCTRTLWSTTREPCCACAKRQGKRLGLTAI